MKESRGVFIAMGGMILCCAAPLIITSLGVVGIGGMMGFINDQLLPLVGALVVVGVLVLGARVFKIRRGNNNQEDCCSDNSEPVKIKIEQN